MGLFDDTLGKNEPRELSKHEAFAGILMSANASDGHVSDEEVQGFFTILLRMRMFSEWSEDRLSRTIDRIIGLLRRRGVDTAMELFARALPENLHKAAFANACDLILADGVVEPEEKEFINKLRRTLGISGDDAQMIAQVMVWKNQG